MNTAFCGPRDLHPDWYPVIFRRLKNDHTNNSVLVGDCIGADAMVIRACQELGLEFTLYTIKSRPQDITGNLTHHDAIATADRIVWAPEREIKMTIARRYALRTIRCVRAADQLVVCGPEVRHRSGTALAVRLAHQMQIPIELPDAALAERMAQKRKELRHV